MTELWQAILLGIVQGITEFLPISSTAHLALVPWLFGWESPLLHSLTFDVALHTGTLLAVLIYFWRDWLAILGGVTRAARRWEPSVDPWQRIAVLIVVGTIPAVIAGALLDTYAETVLRAPLIIASMLIVFGLLLGLAERLARHDRPVDRITLVDALAMGLAQAVAIVPGVSRSGSTITAGLATGLRRDAAARFSFLLSTPIIFGAIVKKLAGLVGQPVPANATLLMLIGAVSAAVAGVFAIHWLVRLLQRTPVYGFVVYRIALGVAIVAVALSR